MPHLSLGNEASPNRRVHSPGPGVVGLAWRRHDVLVHNAGSVEVSVHRGVGAHVLLLHPFRSCLGLAQRVHPPGPGIIGLAGRRHDVLATDPGSVEVSAQRGVGVGVPLLPQGFLDQRLSQHPLRSHRLSPGQRAIAHHAHFIRRVLASSPSPDGGTMYFSPMPAASGSARIAESAIVLVSIMRHDLIRTFLASRDSPASGAL